MLPFRRIDCGNRGSRMWAAVVDARSRMQQITSRHNPIVGMFRDAAAEPDPSGARVLLDGAHLVREARDAHLAFTAVVVATSRLAVDSEEGRLAVELERAAIEVTAAPDQVFAAISPVRTPSGIVAIVR